MSLPHVTCCDWHYLEFKDQNKHSSFPKCKVCIPWATIWNSSGSEDLFAKGNEQLARQNNTRSHLATALSQLLHEFSFPDGTSVCNSRNWGANVQKTNSATENSSHTGCCHFPSLTCVSHFKAQNLFLFAFKSLGEFLPNPWTALCSAESRSGHGSTHVLTGVSSELHTGLYLQ